MAGSFAVAQTLAPPPDPRPTQLALLPRPLPGESLLSWVDHVASTFGLSRTDTAQHLGLHTASMAKHLLRINEPDLDHLRARTGLTSEELSAMTADSGLAKRATGGRRVPFYAGVQRFMDRNSPACPQCVGETEGRWQLDWRLAISVFCHRHRCYLVSQCECRHRLHPSDRGSASRLVCATQRSQRLRPCRRLVADLPAIALNDEHLAAVGQLIDQRLTDIEAPELNWAMHLVLRVGSERQIEDADPDVYAAFSQFCRRRDALLARLRGQPGMVLINEPAQERLILAAVVRIAGALVFADDLNEQAQRFCELATPRWDTVRSDILHPRVSCARLVRAFNTYGMPGKSKWNKTRTNP
ncbi:TniQ family protein [Nocardia sp. NPDC050175]|uniref:TniQ family protein n=1 Tax=Nocardia sp. NPDC050175 TaxID=3364317 RepID=UPI0037950FE8